MIETKVIDVGVMFLRVEEMVSSEFREVNGRYVEVNPNLIKTYVPFNIRYIKIPVRILKSGSD